MIKFVYFSGVLNISSNNIERRGEGKAEFSVNFCQKGFFRDENLLRATKMTSSKVIFSFFFVQSLNSTFEVC